MQEIVGGVARYCDLVAKIKIAKFFSWRVGDSRKFVLAKISCYTVFSGGVFNSKPNSTVN